MTINADTTNLRARLATSLPADLPGPWRTAFQTVERHRFVPRFALRDRATGTFTHYDVDDPDPKRRAAALAAAYTDDTLITRFDSDGRGISSSTEPSLMASMLAALDTQPGHRIMEIGTGTGYNAALLCEVRGDDRVTTIDVDPELTTTAQTTLAHAGYTPTVVCGDGAAGVPDRAPFDRIIATCGVDRVPVAWLDQLAPAGAILATVSTGIVLLRDTGNGTVSGRFHGGAGFMPLRTAGYQPQWPARRIIDHTNTAPDTTHTTTIPAGLDFRTAAMFTGLIAENSDLTFRSQNDTVISHRWIHPGSGSWVRVDLNGDHATVGQAGPRRLWDELTPILDTWQAAGRPDIGRFGLTVHRDGRHVLWLDSPDHMITQLP